MALLLSYAPAHSQEPAHSAANSSKWYQPFCQGKCAATIFFGPEFDTGLANADGSRRFVPPWQYKYGKSYFIGGALSRTFLEFGRFAALEIEGGTGQRFSSLHESEVWSAIYARWRYFPWNDYLVTTFALSTGISYASGVTPYEIRESPDGKGSRVMHYFSPEFTFALPKSPDRELVVRYHHRSGGGAYFGNKFPVYGSLFRGTDGGMEYLTIGFRNRF